MALPNHLPLGQHNSSPMAVSWDGTVSCDEFNSAASAFSKQWRNLNSSLPQWTWVPSPKRPWASHNNQEEGYLSMENLILPRLSEEEDHDSVNDVEEKEECSCGDEDHELSDKATLVQDSGRDHCYDFHIVYSASYKVPVLYFRAYCFDGQPLLLADIEKDIPENSAELLTRSKWTFMTQEEHPYLNRPWYKLHPCGTSEWMKLLLLNEPSVAQGQIPVEKYLVSWFSVVGQVFGLKIPFDMLDTGSLATSNRQ